MVATRLTYTVLAVLAVVGASAVLFPQILPIWAAIMGGFALAAVVEFIALQRTPAPSVTRRTPAALPVGVETEIALEIRCADRRRPVQVEVFDKPPPHCRPIAMPAQVEVAAGKWASVRYQVLPTKRGAHEFDGTDVRVAGPLRLFRRVYRIDNREKFRVLPNFRAVSRYALMAVADKAGRLGIRQVRRRGSGMEFSHLREYRNGDLIRQIDWKASARRQKLISREYEDERDQQVVMMLDCGRNMRARDGDIGHFDQSLNATLLLTHVALRKGDGIAVSTFGGHDIWIPRQRGPRGMNVVVDRLYALEPTLSPSDYVRAAERTSVLQKRRALVVIVTNLYGDVGDSMLAAVQLLRRRHLVLVASLRESVLDELIDAEIEGFDDALRVAAAHDFLSERKRLHKKLSEDGVLVLDVTPEQLSVELVNKYLEIKGRGAL